MRICPYIAVPIRRDWAEIADWGMPRRLRVKIVCYQRIEKKEGTIEIAPCTETLMYVH